jgi:hypothetical protein
MLMSGELQVCSVDLLFCEIESHNCKFLMDFTLFARVARRLLNVNYSERRLSTD